MFLPWVNEDVFEQISEGIICNDYFEFMILIAIKNSL